MSKPQKYTILTDNFDASLYGEPWISVATWQPSLDGGNGSFELDFYGTENDARFVADCPAPGSGGHVEISAVPGTILCHGITRKKIPGHKPEVSRLWYIAADDGEAISLLPMGGLQAAERLAALPLPERLDGFRTVKSIERLDDGGAGMVGKAAPLPSPETLTFGDFLELQSALIQHRSMLTRRLKSEKRIAEDADYSVRLRSCYASAVGERVEEIERLTATLTKLQRCFGKAV